MQDLVLELKLLFLLLLPGYVGQRGEEDGAILLAAQEERAHAHPHELAVQAVAAKRGFGARDGVLVRFGEHGSHEPEVVGVHLARDEVLALAQVHGIAAGDVVVLVVHLRQLEMVGVHVVDGQAADQVVHGGAADHVVVQQGVDVDELHAGAQHAAVVHDAVLRQ